MSHTAQIALLRQRLLRPGSLWFAPQQHIWLQCSPPPTTSVSSSSSTAVATTASTTWRVHWGMTEHGMDRLGDITKVTCLVDCKDSKNAFVEQGRELLRVDWEGYEWTEADELYHTVWESVDGVETIASPITGNLVNVIDPSNDAIIVDEDIAWVEMECNHGDVINTATSWLDQASYHRWVKTLAPSKFSDRAA